MCSNEYPVTDKLVGDDLGKKVEDIQKANKVRSKISGFKNLTDAVIKTVGNMDKCRELPPTETTRLFQTFIPVPIKFNESDTETIKNEISDLLKKGSIEHATSNNDDEYISNIFIRPKSPVL